MNEIASPIPNATTIATTAAVIAASNNTENDEKIDKNLYFGTSAPPSPNTMDYEDMMYEYQQFPSLEEFNAIVNDYLQNLSSKKRDKALVDNHRYSLILQVLKDPRNTAISTAQFRFWVKKMFRLSTTSDHIELVCHDDKPVATREDIYNILITAHKEAHHGGRDKTSALVRKRYSWIPKELIARFVRHCPFCISRRNGCQSASNLEGMLSKSSPIYTPPPLCHTSNNNFLSHHPPAKKRKTINSRSVWNDHQPYYHHPASISMAATVATSAAVAAVASTFISSNHHHQQQENDNSPTFDFYYNAAQREQKQDNDCQSPPNNASSSYTYNFNNATNSAAAVVAAAAIAAVSSTNSSYHHHQQQAPPSPSSVTSSEALLATTKEQAKPQESPCFKSSPFDSGSAKEDKMQFSLTPPPTTNSDSIVLPPSYC